MVLNPLVQRNLTLRHRNVLSSDRLAGAKNDHGNSGLGGNSGRVATRAKTIKIYSTNVYQSAGLQTEGKAENKINSKRIVRLTLLPKHKKCKWEGWGSKCLKPNMEVQIQDTYSRQMQHAWHL